MLLAACLVLKAASFGLLAFPRLRSLAVTLKLVCTLLSIEQSYVVNSQRS